MVSLFGLDLSGAFNEIKGATKDLLTSVEFGGGDRFAARAQQGNDVPWANVRYGASPFDGLSYGGDTFAGLSYGQGDRFGYGDFGDPGGRLYDQFSSSKWDAEQKRAKDEADRAAAARGPQTVGGTVTQGGGPSTGMSAGVARWAGQTQQVFGGLMDPDVMLAIMENESGGRDVQNAQGYPAYGLFQLWEQPGLSIDQQFAAARKLAEQKLAGIAESYAANGLNPDERTRARDFALAWAGHFDYDTGRPNPSSRDVGSGQTAEQYGAIFLGNYDKIKAGRQQVPAAGGGGGWFPVEGATSPLQTHHGAGERGATDIFAPTGTRVLAMTNGVVTGAGYSDVGGWWVSIQSDDGTEEYYAHLYQQPLVSAGQRVQAGSHLGGVGDTGNAKGTGSHLHVGKGYGIISGTGPQGGAGRDFDLITWLEQQRQQRR